MPLISVCLATYNGERFLAKQIQSILDQTLTDFELVISDDGSTDRTGEILSDFAGRDSRIRVLSQQNHLGLQKNFERTISASLGRFIAPSDQDDIWHPAKLETLLQHLGVRDVTMVYCDSAFIDADDRPLQKTLLQSRKAAEGRDPLIFAFYNSVSGHAMLFDRMILTYALPFPDEPLYDWWLAAVSAAIGGLAALPQALVLYRQHEASITARLRQDIAMKRIGRPLEINAEDIRRLAAFSHLPGPAGKTYKRLHDLWSRRAAQFFVPQLAIFLLRHRSIYAFRETSPLRVAWRCLKQAFGLQARHPFQMRNSRKT